MGMSPGAYYYGFLRHSSGRCTTVRIFDTFSDSQEITLHGKTN